MQKSLNNLLDFISFTYDIRNVKRAIYVKDEDVYENDSEHGYQLALVSLYVIEEKGIKLDSYKCMAIALVHDIVEVHAGDVSIFSSKKVKSKQIKRESEAVLKLKKQWPQMTLMHSLIDEYKNKSTPESRFVYALDKLVPMVNNYLDNGRSWKRQNVSLDQVIEIKKGKIDIDPTIYEYYKEVLKLMNNKPELFL